jgi:hypothetical protein
MEFLLENSVCFIDAEPYRRRGLAAMRWERFAAADQAGRCFASALSQRLASRRTLFGAVPPG